MTPQDIHFYKMKWLPGFRVVVGEDSDISGKSWCRANLERHQWSFEKYTDMYEHSFRFEKEIDAINFSKFMNVDFDSTA